MNCRFGAKRYTTELPPGPSEIACELHIDKVGEFRVQMHLYVDDQGTREVVFFVHGKASPVDPGPKSSP